MAIVAKSKFIEEDIVNENGDVIGKIKFNPNDSMIMKKITEIINELSDSINKLKKYDNIDIKKVNNMNTLKEFEEASETFEKMSEMFEIEYEVVNNSVERLKEIFGNECIECFTGGTTDVESLIPLLEYITPYIQSNRSQKVNQYLSKKDEEVLD